MGYRHMPGDCLTLGQFVPGMPWRLTLCRFARKPWVEYPGDKISAVVVAIRPVYASPLEDFILNAYGFMPHGYCFEWRSSVLWLHVGSDLAIAGAYYGLAFAVFYFSRQRRDLPFREVFWLFGAFILLCGTTHLLSIWVLWHADYFVEGYVKAVTATVSVATLITTIIVLPRALGLRGIAEIAVENDRLEGLVASSNDAIMGRTLEGTITSWNAAAEDMFGYSGIEIIGKSNSLLVPQELSDEDELLLNKIKAGDKIEHFETLRRKKTGELFPISISVSPIKDSAGVIIGSTKIVRDITHRKEAEAAAERYAQGEERARVRLGAVVDNAIDGIITIGEEGSIKTFNTACSRLFGYLPGEVMGQNIKMLMPEPYHGEHDGYLSNYLATGNAKIIGTSGREVAARRKDGTIFPMDLSVSAFTVDGVRYFSGIIRDITKQKEVEASRERLLLQLTESNTELERFAYVASHDMQEPLRMVMNFSEVLVRDYAEALDDEGKEYLHIIGDAATRMREMVHELLEYARLGRDGMGFSEVDIAVELGHVRENLAEIIIASQAVMSAEPMPTVFCNAVQIMRLLQNLIANAIKFQPAGQVPRIEIGASRQEGHWLFSVRDNGLGIDAPFIESIFEPYRRLHTWETIKGTGLGLAVCRKIVENHGGKIWATSAGSGSTMYFTLPG